MRIALLPIIMLSLLRNLILVGPIIILCLPAPLFAIPVGNHEVSDVQIRQITQGLSRSTKELEFFHWTKPEVGQRWAQQGYIDSGEVAFYNKPTGDRQVYGGGIYLAEDERSSGIFGTYLVTFTISPGALIYDAKIITRILGWQPNDLEISQLGAVIPFIRNVNGAGGWWLTHNSQNTQNVKAVNPKALAIISDSSGDGPHTKLKKLKALDPKFQDDYLSKLIALLVYQDHVSLQRSMHIDPSNPWNHFEPQNFPRFQPFLEDMEGQPQVGTLAFQIHDGNSRTFGSGHEKDPWVHDQVVSVLPQIHERLSAINHSVSTESYRTKEVRAGGNYINDTFFATPLQLAELKSNPFLKVSSIPSSDNQGYLVSYEYPSTTNYEGIKDRLSTGLLEKLTRLNPQSPVAESEKLNREIILELLTDLFRKYHGQSTLKDQNVEQFHRDLISIHPFPDFNGRVSQLYEEALHRGGSSNSPVWSDFDLLMPTRVQATINKSSKKKIETLHKALLREMVRARLAQKMPDYARVPALQELTKPLGELSGDEDILLSGGDWEKIRTRDLATVLNSHLGAGWDIQDFTMYKDALQLARKDGLSAYEASLLAGRQKVFLRLLRKESDLTPAQFQVFLEAAGSLKEDEALFLIQKFEEKPFGIQHSRAQLFQTLVKPLSLPELKKLNDKFYASNNPDLRSLGRACASAMALHSEAQPLIEDLMSRSVGNTDKQVWLDDLVAGFEIAQRYLNIHEKQKIPHYFQFAKNLIAHHQPKIEKNVAAHNAIYEWTRDRQDKIKETLKRILETFSNQTEWMKHSKDPEYFALLESLLHAPDEASREVAVQGFKAVQEANHVAHVGAQDRQVLEIAIKAVETGSSDTVISATQIIPELITAHRASNDPGFLRFLFNLDLLQKPLQAHVDRVFVDHLRYQTYNLTPEKCSDISNTQKGCLEYRKRMQFKREFLETVESVQALHRGNSSYESISGQIINERQRAFEDRTEKALQSADLNLRSAVFNDPSFFKYIGSGPRAFEFIQKGLQHPSTGQLATSAIQHYRGERPLSLLRAAYSFPDSPASSGAKGLQNAAKDKAIWDALEELPEAQAQLLFQAYLKNPKAWKLSSWERVTEGLEESLAQQIDAMKASHDPASTHLFETLLYSEGNGHRKLGVQALKGRPQQILQIAMKAIETGGPDTQAAAAELLPEILASYSTSEDPAFLRFLFDLDRVEKLLETRTNEVFIDPSKFMSWQLSAAQCEDPTDRAHDFKPCVEYRHRKQVRQDVVAAIQVAKTQRKGHAAYEAVVGQMTQERQIVLEKRIEKTLNDATFGVQRSLFHDQQVLNYLGYGPRAHEFILRGLRSSDEYVRAVAALSISHYRGAELLSLLKTAYSDYNIMKNPIDRAWEIVTKLPEPQAHETLFALLKDPQTRGSALLTLSQFHQGAHRPYYHELLAELLKEKTTQSEGLRIVKDEAVSLNLGTLKALLAHGDPEVRRAAKALVDEYRKWIRADFRKEQTTTALEQAGCSIEAVESPVSADLLNASVEILKHAQ